MILKEKKQNLFTVDDKYFLAHCISSDCRMGAGIAVEFQKRFKLRNKLFQIPYSERIHPVCLKIDKIFNLITKEKYWHKPTYESVCNAIRSMKNDIIINNIKYLATMPKIGCGLDKLQWYEVKKIINEEFKDVDIEILICYL